MKFFKEAIKWTKAPHELESHLKRAFIISEELSTKKRWPKAQKEYKQKCLNVYKRFIHQTFLPLTDSFNQGDQPDANLNAQEKEKLSAGIKLMQDLLEHFECKICFEEMTNVKIFACSNDHWICESCINDKRLQKLCPSCREDYTEKPPQRRLMAEKLAKKIGDDLVKSGLLV